jgi:hypothetical protein
VHHIFPTGTFKTHYTPPLLSKFVLDHFASHPFNWSWTTKSGPNQGKSFCVPCIPTSCQKSDHQVVRWTVDLFHSFKAHLSPRVLNNGQVPTPLVHIYQSNMLIHFHRQLVATQAPLQPPLSTTLAPRKSADSHTQPSPARAPLCPPKNPNTPTELNKLHTEVSRLRKQLATLTLPQAFPSSPISISPLHPPPKGHQSSPPPPLSSSPPHALHAGFPAFPGLHAVFAHPFCPAFIRNTHSNSWPIVSGFVPEDATHICEVHWPPGAFEYYSLDTNGDLYISTNSDLAADVKITMSSDEDEEEIEFQLTP